MDLQLPTFVFSDVCQGLLFSALCGGVIMYDISKIVSSHCKQS